MENKNLDIKLLIEKVHTFFKDFIAGLAKKGKDGKKLEISFWITKHSYLIALWILGIVFLWVCVGLGVIWIKNSSLLAQTWDLKNLSSYDLKEFYQSEYLSEDREDLPQTISGMVEMYRSSKQEKERIEGELNFKKSVYSEFLRNLLLPSLNIWKDPYSQEIDLSIMGKKYLDINPYQDIALLSQWSSIIKESGKDVWDNEVVNMQIGEINELDNGFFNIPISISFKSDSKRAFLLLVDKLSLTSNINNLGLLNDFCYYLFDAIRTFKSDALDQLKSEYALEKSEAQDEKTFNNAIISRYLYRWLSTDPSSENVLLDEEVIDWAIKQSVVCGKDEASDVCYFRFRDKYRTIPWLAYGIGLESLVNKTLAIKNFFTSIPPLIAIDSFTFDKAKAQWISLAKSNEYLWNVSFSIYGRGIAPADADEISQQLSESCFGSWTTQTLNVSGALAPVQLALQQIWTTTQVNVEKMGALLELKDSLLEEGKTFDTLSPYNKMIKRFEFYRMLQNVGLCTK